jgi:phosphate:Na+ symporter
MIKKLSYRNTTLLVLFTSLLVWSMFAESSTIDLPNMIRKLAAGLAIFLFGMFLMEESLKDVAGDKTKMWIRRFTSERFLGLPGMITGTGVTAIVQSSSVVTSILVTFVSTGLMKFSQAIGVILGANIGTTVTAQMIALVGKFDVGEIAVVFILGFYFSFINKKGSASHSIGFLLLGLGLLFMGLDFMSDSMRPLRTYDPFHAYMAQMSNPLLGILVGAAFTALVQSSSATMAIVVAMATQGLVSIEAGIALALGANIGTCVTALAASLGKSREAKRVAFVHVAFNVIGALAFVGFIPYLSSLVVASADTVQQQVANAHTVFNVMAAFMFLPFTKHLADLAVKVLPSLPEDAEAPVLKPKYLLSEEEMDQPMMGEAALTGMRKETLRMGKKVRDMFEAILPAMLEGRGRELDAVADMDKDVNVLNHAITQNIHAIGRSSIPMSTDKQMDTFRDLMSYPEHLESAADEIKNQLVNDGYDRINNQVEISDVTKKKIGMFHRMVMNQFDRLLEVIESSDVDLSPKETKKLEKKLRAIVKVRKKVRGTRRSIVHSLQESRLESDSDSDLRLSAYSVEIDMIEHIEAVYNNIRKMAKNHNFYFIDRPEDEPEELVSETA